MDKDEQASLAMRMCNAAAFGNIALMERLLALGATVDGKAERATAKTPLIYAVENGDAASGAQAVEWLAGAGAALEEASASGATALLWAAGFRQPWALEVLLGLGARVDARDLQGRTALHLAARAGAFDSVRALLGAGADPGSVDASGADPMGVAQNKRVKDLLLSAQERAALDSSTGKGRAASKRAL